MGMRVHPFDAMNWPPEKLQKAKNKNAITSHANKAFLL